MEERLACLELYGRLRAAVPGSSERARALFSVEEDQRKRVFLRLVPDPYATELKPKQWRCTHAVPVQAKTNALVDTVGACLLDWVLDGYNAVLLSMGAEGSGKTYTLFGPPSGTSGAATGASAARSVDADGLVTAFLREVFRVRRKEKFRVGLSWWDVRGSEVRDQNERPVFRNLTKFDVLELQSYGEALEVLTALRERDTVRKHCLKNSTAKLAKPRHLFLRVALFHDQEDHLLSTVHFVDLASESDAECKRDLGSLHVLLREVGGAFAETENHNPSSAAEDADGGGGPNALLRSPVSPQFKSERQLGALLMPLITGNCKTFVLATVPETQLTEPQMEETIRCLDTAERASLMATTCRRLYLRGGVDLIPLRVGWTPPTGADEKIRRPSVDLSTVGDHVGPEDLHRVRRFTGDSSILAGDQWDHENVLPTERLFADEIDPAIDRRNAFDTITAPKEQSDKNSFRSTTRKADQEPPPAPPPNLLASNDPSEDTSASPRGAGEHQSSMNSTTSKSPAAAASTKSIIAGTTVRASSSTARLGSPEAARGNKGGTTSATGAPAGLLQQYYGNTSNYLEVSRPPDSPKKQPGADKKLAQDYEALLLAHRRVLKQVEVLQASKVSAVDHDLLTDKYRRALRQIETLEEREIGAEELAERDLQIQDLKLAVLDVKKKLRAAVGEKLVDLDLDVSRNPYALFDELETEITRLRREVQAQQERNVRLALELERYQNPLGVANLDSAKLPKFVKDLQRDLQSLRQREDEFARSERSNKLVSKCVQDLTTKLGRTEQQLKESQKRADLAEKKADASEEFLEKVLKKARETESDLEIMRKTNEGLEIEVAGLKEACFHHMQYKRQDDLLTKFLPLSRELKTGSTRGSVLRAGGGATTSWTGTNPSKVLTDNFEKLHKEITGNPDLRFIVPLSARVKSGLDALLRQHSTLEEKAATALQVMQRSVADEIRDVSPAPSARSQVSFLSTGRRGNRSTLRT
ncbi:unnamed protein product [Amoebophrya sp. A120]|nr:unnamed protein product [Amoebophrya sp. A120]|eukprot:GSA120T00002196001.1